MLELTVDSPFSYGIASGVHGPPIIPLELGYAFEYEGFWRDPLGLGFFMAASYFLRYQR